MHKLPIISGLTTIKTLEKMGFKKVRQKGSHVVLRKDNKGCVIPLHKELAIGTLKGILRQAGVSVEDFLKQLKET